MAGLVLHNYFRSSTSIRVRVALNLKGLDYAYVAHHLRRGEHRGDAYRAVNPHTLVPALELADGTVLTQSLAIIEYLDEVFPAAAVAAERAARRGRGCGPSPRRSPARSIRSTICACSTICSTRFGADDAAVRAWIHHWVAETFVPLEAMLAGDARDRNVLPWRAARHGRRLPLRAGDHQPALRRRHGALSDDRADFCSRGASCRPSRRPRRKTSRTPNERALGSTPKLAFASACW